MPKQKTESQTKTPYEMTLSLNVLNHLGINLYSNVPAVLSEVVANSWDADAAEVDITIGDDTIIIQDNGEGMTLEDINGKYLYVGYQRRSKTEGRKTPIYKREVMGRKGIGKLSLFSIAENIRVYSIKGGKKSAFLMSSEDIKKVISNKEGKYHPKPLSDFPEELIQGTRIVISGLKNRLNRTPTFLRRRLARRFTILGSKYNFQLSLNDDPITLSDRDYFDKLEYIWYYGKEEELSFFGNENAKEKFLRSSIVTSIYDESDRSLDRTFPVEGWIATVAKSGDLRDEDITTSSNNLNKIGVVVRGKLADEDVLVEFNEGGVFSKYLIGEISANFLDIDEELDIATSSRQDIMQDDPRYQALLTFIQSELKVIQSSWTALRNDAGVEEALKIPAVETWFNSLKGDDKSQAKKLFAKFNEIPNDPEIKKKLFKYGVLAFESLRQKSALSKIDKLTIGDIEKFGELFMNLDDIESGLYRQIVTDRLKIIQAMQDKVDEGQLEKVIQAYLYDHLWLLDPSWERVVGNSEFEVSLGAKLTADRRISIGDEATKGRIDIKYKTIIGKHVIIELKKPDRTIKAGELIDQGDKYNLALQELLAQEGRAYEPIEIIFLVGKHPSNWSNPKFRESDIRSLEAKSYRILTYSELLSNARKAYSDYLKAKEEVSRIEAILADIESTDFS